MILGLFLNWNDYITVIVAALTGILLLIQICHYLRKLFPKKPKIRFSRIIARDTTQTQNTKRTIRIDFDFINIGDTTCRFDIKGELKFQVSGIDQKPEFSREPIENFRLVSKTPDNKHLTFEFPLNLSDWTDPKVRFTYEYSLKENFITKSTKWIKAKRK